MPAEATIHVNRTVDIRRRYVVVPPLQNNARVEGPSRASRQLNGNHWMTSAPTIVEQRKGNPWHTLPVSKVLTELATTSEGLSFQEAARRLAANGPNELKEGKRISPLRIFFGQFKSLIIWILIAAGVISGLLGERVDAIAILAIALL